jgi:hypothetical protein
MFTHTHSKTTSLQKETNLLAWKPVKEDRSIFVGKKCGTSDLTIIYYEFVLKYE